MKDELTLEFCLREIADNITNYKQFGLRIGLSRLDFMCEGYEVLDWFGHRTYHVDLVDAIGKFIEVNK